MTHKRRMELLRLQSQAYAMTIEEYQEQLDYDINIYKVAIEICNQDDLKLILKDKLIGLQDLKLNEPMMNEAVQIHEGVH